MEALILLALYALVLLDGDVPRNQDPAPAYNYYGE